MNQLEPETPQPPCQRIQSIAPRHGRRQQRAGTPERTAPKGEAHTNRADGRIQRHGHRQAGGTAERRAEQAQGAVQQPREQASQ